MLCPGGLGPAEWTKLPHLIRSLPVSRPARQKAFPLAIWAVQVVQLFCFIFACNIFLIWLF
jgi:hypothetical protein